MSTVAIIQARSGSTRFPRKVLADLRGRPMLEHVITRVQSATTVDRVVLATTTEPDDDVVATLGMALGAAVTRGPVDDVLTRYVMAAREHDAAVVVRITADCPLCDPEVVDHLVRLRQEAGADYASNLLPATFPDGYDVEVLTAACLQRLDGEARLAYEREHVTIRVREHPEAFHTVNATHEPDALWMRCTVDVPDDLRRVARILELLPETPPPGVEQVIALMQTDPMLGEQSRLPDRDERYRAQRQAAQQEADR